MNFGDAIAALKAGKKVARSGWNGKGMWLVLVPGSLKKVTITEGTPYHAAGLREVFIGSHIDMFTAHGNMQPGWLASQTDMLAEDWEEVK